MEEFEEHFTSFDKMGAPEPEISFHWHNVRLHFKHLQWDIPFRPWHINCADRSPIWSNWKCEMMQNIFKTSSQRTPTGKLKVFVIVRLRSVLLLLLQQLSVVATNFWFCIITDLSELFSFGTQLVWHWVQGRNLIWEFLCFPALAASSSSSRLGEFY